MKTTLVEMNKTVGFCSFPELSPATRQNRSVNPGHAVFTPSFRRLAQPVHRPEPTWLPAPQDRPKAAALPDRRQVRSADKALRIQISRTTLEERAMWGLMVLASAGAIGYGFICLLDLVQNWAQFTLGVAHFIN
jgi:hypothetical protein